MPISIISTIIPSNNGNFATHDAKYGLGGWFSVLTIADMNAISQLRRTAGMACRVTANDSTYFLNADLVTWVLESKGDYLRYVEYTAINAGLQTINTGIVKNSGYCLCINGLPQSINSYSIGQNTVTVPETSNVLTDDFLMFSYYTG